MATYIITIENDTKQQLVFHAPTVSEALDKAKQVFTESMVTGLDGPSKEPLSNHHKTILLNAPRINHKANKVAKIDREYQREQVLLSIPD